MTPIESLWLGSVAMLIIATIALSLMGLLELLERSDTALVEPAAVCLGLAMGVFFLGYRLTN